MRVKQLFFLITILFISACSTSRHLNQKNLAHLYQTDKMLINQTIQVYHQNDTLTSVILMYNANDLLHIKNVDKELYTANLIVAYNLYISMESIVDLSTGSINFIHECSNDSNEVLSGKIDIKIDSGIYILELLHTDINRKYTFQTFYEINKSSFLSHQNFLLNDVDGNLIFGNQIVLNRPFILKHNSFDNQKILARYYNRTFPASPPPFSINNPKPFDYKADSLFAFNLTDTIRLSKTGFYHFQLDTNITDGFTVYCFNEPFPFVGTTNNMIEAIRYLTSKKEFLNIKTSSNKKRELDEFWLKNASSPERAKHLVKTYYNRVQDANRFFTSYIQGWQTDRGMIYVVFGPPNTIYKSSDSESWIYGDEKNYLSYNFSFVKVDNPFTNNDFMLNRSNIYRYSWSQAVETWRRGRVYNVSNIKREQDERRLRQQMHFWY